MVDNLEDKSSSAENSSSNNLDINKRAYYFVLKAVAPEFFLTIGDELSPKNQFVLRANPSKEITCFEDIDVLEGADILLDAGVIRIIGTRDVSGFIFNTYEIVDSDIIQEIDMERKQ